eukprot:TRINITY_DN24813_c0_g1_i1.p1 TRINITY_DN24813_c0_g1~~TRINITY_DN24813_c0_g1_i1.p1  ORF type:complete len:490 (-),score=109.18 TRINITY_DN24813_c0_g1_i1:198-1667(-)
MAPPDGSPEAKEPLSPLPSRGAFGGNRERGQRGRPVSSSVTRQERQRRGKSEWTPWKDRVKGAKDAVLLVEITCDHCEPERVDRRCLFTASADGVARLLELPRGSSPAVLKQKLDLVPPPDVLNVANGRGAFVTVFLYMGRRPADQLSNALAAPSAAAAAASVAVDLATGGLRTWIYAGYHNGSVVAYDAMDGHVAFVLAGHEMEITCLRPVEEDARAASRGSKGSESGSGPSLLSASMDGTVRAWAIQHGREQMEPSCLFLLDFGLRNPVTDLQLLSGTQVLSSAWDGQLRFIDLRQRTCTGMIGNLEVAVHAVCVTEDAASAFVATEDCHIRCLNLHALPPTSVLPVGTPAGKELFFWKAHTGPVVALRLWRCMLISAAEDCSIRLWNISTGTLLEDFYGHAGAVLSLCISRKEGLLWSGSRDFSVRSWDLCDAERRAEDRRRMAEADAEAKAIRKEEYRLKREAKKKGKKPGKREASESRGRRGRG